MKWLSTNIIAKRISFVKYKNWHYMCNNFFVNLCKCHRIATNSTIKAFSRCEQSMNFTIELNFQLVIIYDYKNQSILTWNFTHFYRK